MSKYAIDFDSTICERHGIPTKKESIMKCKPIEGAFETLEWLLERGHEFYIFTTHEPISEIPKWLNKYKFKPEIKLITNIKQPGTKAFIDDRAIRFTSWQDIRKLLE